MDLKLKNQISWRNGCHCRIKLIQDLENEIPHKSAKKTVEFHCLDLPKCGKVCKNLKMTSLKSCKVCKNAKSIVTTMGSQRFQASQKSKNTRELANFQARLSPLSTHMDFDAQKRNTYATFFLRLRSRSTHMDFDSQKCNTYATFDKKIKNIIRN